MDLAAGSRAMLTAEVSPWLAEACELTHAAVVEGARPYERSTSRLGSVPTPHLECGFVFDFSLQPANGGPYDAYGTCFPSDPFCEVDGV